MRNLRDTRERQSRPTQRTMSSQLRWTPTSSKKAYKNHTPSTTSASPIEAQVTTSEMQACRVVVLIMRAHGVPIGFPTVDRRDKMRQLSDHVKDGGLERRAESRALVDSVAHEITPAWDMTARTHFDDHRRQPEVGAHLRVRG